MNLSQVSIKSSEPLYLQIKASLIAAIEDREMLPGEKIPSLEELSKLYGVSRMTVRQAIQELIHEGRLYTVIGKGTFVEKETMIEPPMNIIWGFFDYFSEIAGKQLSRLLSITIQSAGEKIAKRLSISPESQVYLLSRQRLINQKPVAVEYAHLPVDRFPGLESFDWNNASLYAVLRENYHILMVQGTQYVEAISASDEIAKLLQVQPQTPILMVDRIISSSEGQVVEFAHTYYRADRVRLLITMSKDEPLTLVKAEASSEMPLVLMF